MSQNLNNMDINRRSFLRGRWRNRTDIDTSCLNNMGVFCQSCKEACDEGAIIFNQVQKGIRLPMIISGRCTHCKKCVECCPADAITISDNE